MLAFVSRYTPQSTVSDFKFVFQCWRLLVRYTPQSTVSDFKVLLQCWRFGSRYTPTINC